MGAGSAPGSYRAHAGTPTPMRVQACHHETVLTLRMRRGSLVLYDTVLYDTAPSVSKYDRFLVVAVLSFFKFIRCRFAVPWGVSRALLSCTTVRCW